MSSVESYFFIEGTQHGKIGHIGCQKKAIRKYQSKFIEMRLRVTPEYHDEISQHAQSMGESDAAFLRRAVAETMERDKHSDK